MEIGLATLRRDGFGYLSQKVPDSSAHFETAPFEGTNPSKVFLNVEGVSAEHPITVQLLDEFARPVKGSLAQVTSSGTRVEVPFSQEVPAGKTFALRVELPTTGDAKLYALYVAE